jgi:hypothetical protein
MALVVDEERLMSYFLVATGGVAYCDSIKPVAFLMKGLPVTAGPSSF